MPGRISPGFKEPGLFKPDPVGRSFGTSVGAAPLRPATAKTYYVNPVDGLDANNGLGPDASDATNKPWKTMGKVLGATGIGNGDTVYLSPGVYRETVTINMTSATCPTYVIGDPGNTQGFKTAAGVLISSGQVRWTCFTTDDKTASPDIAALKMNGRPFLNFMNIWFVGGRSGNAFAIDAGTTFVGVYQHDTTFKNCAFLSEGANAITWGDSSGTAKGYAWNLSFDGCLFNVLGASAFRLNLIAQPGALDIDLQIAFRNCKFIGQHGTNGLQFDQNGGSGGIGGGVVVDSCSFLGFNGGITFTTAAYSIANPLKVLNCLIFANGNGLIANTTGQIYEDYNQIQSGTPRQNVTVGPHSSSNIYSNIFHFGQELKYGGNPRVLLEPTKDSVHLSYNKQGVLGEDFRGIPRTPQSTGLGTIGADERSNSWLQETTTVRTGSNAISITGPGVQDFDIPVDASTTTFSIWMRFNSAYVGPRPSLIVINGAECGVSDQVTPMQAPLDTWEQLSITFTPTRAGIVTMRLLSNDYSGAGKAFADDFSVS